MSRLYGDLTGQAQATVTRRGSKNSGIRTHVRGWNSGVEVYGYVDDQDRDVFEVYRTGGSNAAYAPRLIARVIGDQAEHVGRERPWTWGEV